MKKYFKIECSDGRKFNVKNKTKWLIANNLFHLDRSLRNEGWQKDSSSGLEYKCEKEYVESLDEIELGEVKSVANIEVDEINLHNDSNTLEFDVKEEQEVSQDLEYLTKQYHKSIKQNQRLKDELRIIRRENRFDDRVENVVTAFHNKILEDIPKCEIVPLKLLKDIENTVEGIVQISDIHANELVENKYNLEIMNRRIKKIFSKAVKIFQLHNVKTINILLTGDLINAGMSNHLDKMLMNEKTRAEGLKFLYESLSEVIDGCLELGFIIKIGSVLGNESRLDGLEHMSNSNSIAVNNLDYLLIVLLQARYRDNVVFLNDGNTLDDMLTINNKNIVLLHGHQIKHSSDKVMFDEILRIKKKWYNKKGLMADYILLGHIHNTLINSFFARSGSLVGGNDYSETGLNIPDSCISQNIFLVDDEIVPIPIFLKE